MTSIRANKCYVRSSRCSARHTFEIASAADADIQKRQHTRFGDDTFVLRAILCLSFSRSPYLIRYIQRCSFRHLKSYFIHSCVYSFVYAPLLNFIWMFSFRNFFQKTAKVKRMQTGEKHVFTCYYNRCAEVGGKRA